MALDHTGEPHFAYFMERDRDLYYSGPNGDGTWYHVLVDADGDTGEQCQVMFDADEIPHILYHANNHYAGRHARLEGDEWVIEELFSGTSYFLDSCVSADGGLMAGFVIDPEGYTPAAVWLYEYSGGWDLVSLGCSMLYGCYLELDPAGDPALLHRRYQGQPLRIETRSDGQWEHTWVDLESVDSPVQPADDLCFLLDSQGQPHIVYIVGESEEYRKVYYVHLE